MCAWTVSLSALFVRLLGNIVSEEKQQGQKTSSESEVYDMIKDKQGVMGKALL